MCVCVCVCVRACVRACVCVILLPRLIKNKNKNRKKRRILTLTVSERVWLYVCSLHEFHSVVWNRCIYIGLFQISERCVLASFQIRKHVTFLYFDLCEH